ncbi:MAG TPA: CRTAC1 family protein [Terriglobales bacterium]
MSRRKRLIWKYTAACCGVVLVAGSTLLLAHRHRRPYVPGQQVEGITQDLSRTLPPDYPRVQFTDVTEQAGIHFTHFPATRTTQLPEDMGSGAAWGDYDGDGWPDLYVVDIAGPLNYTPEQMARSPGGNRLYHNNHDGTFTDVTERAGVGFKGIGMGAAWADYDNDGRLDLVVTSYDRIILYHNNGDGTFTDVSKKAGLDKFRGFWSGPAWGDYDRDGNVDLYVCGYVKYSFHNEDLSKSSMQYTTLVPFTLNPSSYPPERNLLFHNNGDGTFTEAGKQAGVQDVTGRSLSAVWYDFNGDGWPDLYVANDVSESAMYLNLRNGKFKPIAHEAWVSDYRGAMGLAVGDWDRDGDPDIFITHWIAQQNALFDNLRYTRAGGGKPGPLRFEDVADTVGLGQISLNSIGWGTSFFDYDNDGQLDLMVVNGSTFQDDKDPRHLVPMKNFLFWQKSPEDGFFEVGAVSGPVFQQAHVGRGAAFADYDNDGDEDVFIVNQEGRPMLLRNDGGNRNNWIKVRVKCTKSNRTGFGTKIEVEAGGQKQYDQIGGQASYLSQNFPEAHFGLNHEKEVQRIKVNFPSGIVRVLEHVPANQIVTVEEVPR